MMNIKNLALDVIAHRHQLDTFRQKFLMVTSVYLKVGIPHARLFERGQTSTMQEAAKQQRKK